MERLLTVATPAGAGRQAKLEGFPDQCPRCHSNVVPKSLVSVARAVEPSAGIEEAFQCTNTKCAGIFIGRFDYIATSVNPNRYRFVKSFPLDPQPPIVAETVRTLSSTFFQTYSQALVSESLGLTQLTGIGLRKALEFLVKDFAIAEHPTDREAIEKKPLGACINDYLTDATVRETAKRAVWLGNDETHYIRKWVDRDVTDLKVLIHLTVNGIDNILLSRKYIAEMK